MELIEFKSKVMDGKYLSLPHGVLEKIKNIGEVEVVLKLSSKQGRRNMGEDAENERVGKAFDQYKTKYPNELVEMEDFRYVGILPEDDSVMDKNALIKAIGELYNDI